jgi:L-threonylcarbamoyladenylate synthase
MDNNMLKKAINILNSGGVVAFPTETVYGIGAALNQPAAIKRIYKIKNRPRSKPLQVLVSTLDEAKSLGVFNKQALSLAKVWPGPLTLVVPKTKRVPKLITGGTQKVGIRIPNNKTVLSLIEKIGPLVATSANQAGETPALTAKKVKENLPAIDYILPGRVKFGKASRVIEVGRKIKILRK